VVTELAPRGDLEREPKHCDHASQVAQPRAGALPESDASDRLDGRTEAFEMDDLHEPQ
jgi:hypothetical protein